MSLPKGTLFRVNKLKAKWQVDSQNSSKMSREELVELAHRILWVATGEPNNSANYPIDADIHPLYAVLVGPHVFYRRFNLDEIDILEEVLDEQESH